MFLLIFLKILCWFHEVSKNLHPVFFGVEFLGRFRSLLSPDLFPGVEAEVFGRLPKEGLNFRGRKVGIFELTEGICLDMGVPPKIGEFSPKMEGENNGKPLFFNG